MAGVASRTVYEVITRYHVQDLGGAELARYDKATRRADRSTRSMRRGLGMASRAAAKFSMMIAPLVGGAVGLASFGYATAKAFRNLNEEMNNSIQLAGQLNLAFKFSEDPAANFVASMKVSKEVFRDMVKDAAALPGELGDFLGMGRNIGLSLFSAGGSTEQYRQMIAKLALVTPMAGGQFDVVGLGAMQMLQGTAQIRNPLFSTLKTGNLLGNISDTGDWNVLPLAERLARLDAGLSRLVDNEMFRSAVLDTFDTQLGTLADNLFGISGIAGELGANAFDGLLESLTKLNVWLEDNQEKIVHGARVMGINSVGLTGLDAKTARAFVTEDISGPGSDSGFWGWFSRLRENSEKNELVRERALRMTRQDMMASGMSFSDVQSRTGPGNDVMWLPTWGPIYRHYLEQGPDALARAVEEKQKREAEPTPEGIHRDTLEPPHVEQTFNMTMHVSTDESPDATAIRMRRAIAEATDHPTVSGRAVDHTTQPAATR